MKRILTVVALSAFATSVFAQGTINFKNQTSTAIKQWTSSTDQTLVNVPINSGFVQLFWANTGAAYTPWAPSMGGMTGFLAANPGWTLDSNYKPFSPVPGLFNGGVLTLNTATPGGSIDAVLVGWNGSATSFDLALAAGGFVGVSGKFTTATGNPNALPVPGSPVSIQSVIPAGMTLAPVPEPSTLALAGLGAAALLIFRRRK